MGVAAATLQQFVAYVAAPGGFGDPGPLRFNLRDQRGESEELRCHDECYYARAAGCGDKRLDPTGRHMAAQAARRRQAGVGWPIRIARLLDRGCLEPPSAGRISPLPTTGHTVTAVLRWTKVYFTSTFVPCQLSPSPTARRERSQTSRIFASIATTIATDSKRRLPSRGNLKRRLGLS